MTHNFGIHFTQELANRYGLPTDDWPASTEPVTSFFTIVVNAVGRGRALDWFEAARRAERRVDEVDQARTYQFGFAAYLADALDFYGQRPTLAETVAWEAVKGAREVARHGSGIDRDAGFDVLLDCAVRACGRSSSRQDNRSTGAAATA
ncbi:hypothetical protein [Streptomyces sp. AC602_WCS936]|uniref:hypothetical protein n=1 Tax=Streptomyces sp. AC602_WCS936 TaxID=2823685 RepID=UPI001C255E83|nr:hypothetical protein [Streptomyces sp. AC602_WCS936]